MKNNRKVKTIEIHQQSDLMASKQRIQSGKNYSMELLAVGVLIKSSKGRELLVPFANLRCIELFPEQIEIQGKCE